MVHDSFASENILNPIIWFSRKTPPTFGGVLSYPNGQDIRGPQRMIYLGFYRETLRIRRQLQVAPNNLAERLENLFKLEYGLAVAELERLVEETVRLVEIQMPEIYISLVQRDLSKRRAPWTITPS